MNEQEIRWCIKNQNYKERALEVVYNNELPDREDMRVNFGISDGPGCYRAVEFPHKGEIYFIPSLLFDQLRKTCPRCGGPVEERDIFSDGEDILICDTCKVSYKSQYGSPLKFYKDLNKGMNLPKPQTFLNEGILYWKQRARAAENVIREVNPIRPTSIKPDLDARRVWGEARSKPEPPMHTKDIPYKKLVEVTRVTIVDSKGRSYEKHGIDEMVMDFQDGDKTLKIFIKEK